MKRFLLIASVIILSACQEQQAQEVTLLDGTPVDLESIIDGRAAIVNFWAASCSFCKDELPHFEDVAETHPDIVVIGVNLQEPQNTAATYWASGGYDFLTLLDPGSQLKSQFDVFTQPTTFFVDAEGNEVFRKNGPLSAKELKELVQLIELQRKETEETEESEETEDAKEANAANEASEAKTSPVSRLLSKWYQGTVDHLIPLQEILSGGPPKDGIPSIDTPKFLTPRLVDFLTEDDVGILVEKGNHVKFYPYSILNWHEIVNDEIDGEDIVVTYCPLCATGVVYSSLISEGFTEFGVSGMLYQSNLLMYDRLTESLWNQVTGQAVVGPLVGEKLHRIKSDIVRYSAAKAVSPDVLVLSTDTGYSRDYDRSPYGNYEEQERTIFPTTAAGDDRLHPKTLVYGVTLGDAALAITEDFIQEQVVFQGYLGEDIVKIPLQIEYDPRTERVTITRYYKEEPGKKDVLTPIPAFWFSWLSQHPNTKLMH